MLSVPYQHLMIQVHKRHHKLEQVIEFATRVRSKRGSGSMTLTVLECTFTSTLNFTVHNAHVSTTATLNFNSNFTVHFPEYGKSAIDTPPLEISAQMVAGVWCVYTYLRFHRDFVANIEASSTRNPDAMALRICLCGRPIPQCHNPSNTRMGIRIFCWGPGSLLEYKGP